MERDPQPGNHAGPVEMGTIYDAEGNPVESHHQTPESREGEDIVDQVSWSD